MSLFANSKLIAIDVYYIEEIKPNGNNILTFIRSERDFDNWKQKGYKTEDEISASNIGKSPGSPMSSYDPSKVINTIRTEWKKLSWKDQNNIFSGASKQIPSGDGKVSTEIDVIKYREMKLKACLKRWSLKDDKDQIIPVSDSAIESLLPEVANELLNSFERVIEPSETELKN